jgi:hypothetical protein
MTRSGFTGPALARHAILPLAAMLLFAGFVILWLDFRPLYFAILEGQGQHPFWFPFLDTHALLAAIECKRMGYDVYVADPCDVLNRLHVYSPMFLELSFLPVSVRDTAIVGTILSLGFFIALAAVPPPAGRIAWLLTLLALASDMTVYGVERGNNDLLIFIMVAAAGRLMLSVPAARMVGYALVMLAAFLKFYPITLMVLALRERPRVFVAIALTATAALALFLVHYRTGLAMAMALTPNGSYFTDFFGAVNLPRGLAELLTPLRTASPVLGKALPYLPPVLLAALVVSCLRDAVGLAIDDSARERFAALPAPQALFLAIGAVLISSCFFAGQNIDYRGIAFLFLLPGLCALGRGPDGRVFLRAAVTIVFLTWSEFFRHLIELGAAALDLSSGVERTVEAAFWLVRELLWWRVIAILAGLILGFAATSEIGAMVLERVVPLRKAVR